jgi:hypothetical protein
MSSIIKSVTYHGHFFTRELQHVFISRLPVMNFEVLQAFRMCRRKNVQICYFIAQDLFDIYNTECTEVDITKSIKYALILVKELYVCSILVQQVAQCCPLFSPAAAATTAATAAATPAAATPAAGQTAPVAAAPTTSIVDARLLAVAPLLYCIEELQPMGVLITGC